MADESPTTVLPARFGRYRVASKIAAGGMATVYLARTGKGGSTQFEKLVALKAIHAHLADQPAFVNMFLDECRIASAIDHPNVCSVLDFGQEQGIYYLAMEFLLGESLSHVARAVARRKDPDELISLPWYVSRVVADACEGLHAAHELVDTSGTPLDVVHRDVSPENIVVTYDGAVKLVDFGVAKAAQRIHETQVAKIKGKFAYVSPEQVHNHDLDRRTDIWGLGVCLWESLTLKRLFRRDSDAATLSAVLFDEIPAPSTVRPWVPARLDAIVLRALARDPKDRYPDARALGLALREFLTETGATIGIAETGDWMQRLFAKERAQRTKMVQRAKQGLETGAFVLENAEGSNSGGTMPSISVQISAEEIEQIEEREGRAPARVSSGPGAGPTMAPPARQARAAQATDRAARDEEPTKPIRRTGLPDDDELLRDFRGRGRYIAVAILAILSIFAVVLVVRPELRTHLMFLTGLIEPAPIPIEPDVPPPTRGDLVVTVEGGGEVWRYLGRSPVRVDVESGDVLTVDAAGREARAQLGGSSSNAIVDGDELPEPTAEGEPPPLRIDATREESGWQLAANAESAKLFLRVGESPATLEDVDSRETHEFLVVRDGASAGRAFVAPGDWESDPQSGEPHAELSVTLDASP